MQNLINILSILAFVMSTITWICTLLNHSIKLFIEIKDYAHIFDVVQLYIYFQNNSGKPITISGVSIVESNNKIPCKTLPSIIRSCNGRVIIETPLFPLNLSSHQGACFAFEFLNCPDIELNPGKTIALEIYTNRKLLKRFVTLGNKDQILNLR